MKTEIPWFYLGCPKCSRRVNQYLNPETEEIEADKFTCDQCQKIVDSTVTRYQVHVKVTDDTGTTSLLMFDSEVIKLIHKSAYELLEQQVQFNRGRQYPQELLALDGREFVFTIFKPETSKNFMPTTFKVVTFTEDPVKIQTFLDGNDNTADTAAIGPHSPSSIELTTNLIEDVSVEVSNNNSISGSTESPATTSKKRAITSDETPLPSENCVASLSAKKLKPEVTPLPEEEAGQLSSTKPKSSIKQRMLIQEVNGCAF
ncbi:unnamed protein product [Microthlaspi erraticum]|uniref:Replication factor A C-terminal domain-containing protein n=1 Tax=Microthlaspi erraticum TaxID=1685480 RepID=A0A6D2KS53_9BRAS|nr:unnamed protein product [Microthlaspi erraticum]